jgi:hypothetical protein
MNTEKLTQKHIEAAKDIRNRAEKLKDCDLTTLSWRPGTSSWNVLECLEHLNLYGDFYLPEIARHMAASHTVREAEFNSGLLGGYFAKSMLPKEKLNKMKTFKDKNPLNAKLDKGVISKFINQQEVLLDLLDKSKMVSLNKVKINISISKWIKLKLGDTFDFYINHMLRHCQQIDAILAEKARLENGYNS